MLVGAGVLVAVGGTVAPGRPLALALAPEAAAARVLSTRLCRNSPMTPQLARPKIRVAKTSAEIIRNTNLILMETYPGMLASKLLYGILYSLSSL